MLISTRERSLLYKVAVYALTLSFKKAYKRRMKRKMITKRLRPRPISSTNPEKREYRPHDYYASQWWKLITHPGVSDPTTAEGKKFRKRFRVPYFVFLQLLVMTRQLGVTDRTKSAAGIEGIPLELKLLGVLRVLGRGTCFDGIEELTGGSAEMHRCFFMKFINLFTNRFYSSHVYLPRNENELKRTMMDYERMGLPGAVGSTDCVHVKWERCPAAYSNACTGKEGYPTLAFQCTVNHKMRFMSVSNAFFGSSNDKTICKFDELTAAMHAGTQYNDNTFKLRTRDGEIITEKGLYLICDGGFCQWRTLITGFKYFSVLEEAHWSVQMESTRKDVERSFGILKGRFRSLKLPILIQNKKSVQEMFQTCCILHNLIRTADGRDSLWESDVNWSGTDGEHDVNDDQDDARRDDDNEWDFSESNKKILFKRALRKLADYSSIGRRFHASPSEASEEESEAGFFQLRRKLVNHYYYLSTFEPQSIEWLN